jgi:hypothetical protein
MIPFNFTLSSSNSGLVIGALWLIYIYLYWRALFEILRAPAFEVNDKILWFLVITMAPFIGLITYKRMVPKHVRQPIMKFRPPNRPQ